MNPTKMEDYTVGMMKNLVTEYEEEVIALHEKIRQMREDFRLIQEAATDAIQLNATPELEQPLNDILVISEKYLG